MEKIKNQIQSEWTARSKDLYDLRKLDGKTTHFGPDPEELKIHQKSLDKIIKYNNILERETNILVLGATPELRDLGLMNGCNVYCVDANKNILETSKKHLEITNRNKEKIFLSDWKNLDMISDETISYIMGSASINNIPYESIPKVFDELKRISNKKSIVSLRHIVFPDIKREEYSLNNVLKDYRKGLLSNREFYVTLRFNSFLDQAYDQNTKILYAKKVFDEFDYLYNNGTLNKKEHEYLTLFRNNVEHTLISQQETKKLFEKQLGECHIKHAQGERYFEDIYNIFEMEIKK